MSAPAEWLAITAVGLTGASGVPGLFVGRRSRSGERVAAAMMALGAAAGIAAATVALARPGAGLSLPWQVPGGALHVEVDAIAAMFLLQIVVIGFLGALYGLGYWRQIDHPRNGRKLRLFYGLIVGALALVVIARNAILFLAGWEVTALAAFFAITTEDEKREVREVGFVYLVATRIGTLCLFALFGLLFAARGDLTIGAPPTGAAANAIFLLGLVGFGIKAGLMPLHVWLPGAHANAPSHVSALMSGVLIKIGIYGLVRLSSLFPHPPLWWGGLVLALGAVSGVLGVAFAIGQHDLKRLLAYHSVENIGIICLGLGTALIGRSLGRTDLVALGLAGALLHTWNHGLFKALLFLSAGSVLHATHTREIDRMGGLAHAMPRTALLFLVGAVAICGLPPLNGFVSELLVYLGLFRTITVSGRVWLVGAFGAPVLALVGALAVACFVKVYGAVFLGQPRSEAATGASESGRAMLLPAVVLAALCALIGIAAPLLAPVLDRAISAWTAPVSTSPSPLAAIAPLGWTSLAAIALIAAVGLAAAVLASRLRARPAAAAVGTWDCGYARPAATMQYTSSSFAETLVGLFAWALRPSAHRPHLSAPFPRAEGFKSHVPETVLDLAVTPPLRAIGRAFLWLHFLQRGSVQRYLLYILLTLMFFFFVWRSP